MNKKITTRTIRSIDGNHAVAEALRQVNPDVFGFYPITPTAISEKPTPNTYPMETLTPSTSAPNPNTPPCQCVSEHQQLEDEPSAPPPVKD